jgi:energy-coupling factor transporter transmembrane protein EcfT
VRFPPVFRLIVLLALGAALFRYSLLAQLCLATVLAGLAAVRGKDSLTQMIRALRRIRWLLLSLAIIYLVVAPEPGSSSSAGGILPAWADVELALRRAGVLVLLVCTVELIRQTTPAPELASAVALCLTPLRWLGLDTERFSRRVALTLEAVPRTADAVAHAAARSGIRGRDLSGWSEAAAALVRDIETGATHTPAQAELPRPPRPSTVDWIVLLAVLGCLIGLLRV